VDGERKAVEADLWPVRYLATLLGSTARADHAVVHPNRGAAARSCCGPAAPGRDAPGAPMSREPPVNLDRLVGNIMLDCSLLRWFAFNRCRDEVLAAIALQRTRANDTEGQVLDFLVRRCGGQQ
jgi:hypothetical protein